MDERKSIVFNINQTIQGNVEGTVTGVDIRQLSAVLGREAASLVERPVPRLSAPRRQEDSALVGRDAVLQEMADRLHGGGSAYFFGAYGAGKTVLSSELFNRIVAEKPPANGFLWAGVSGMSAEDIMEWIAGALGEESVSQATGLEAKTNLLRLAFSSRKGLLIGLDDVRDGDVALALLNAAGECAFILNGARQVDTAGLARAVEVEPLLPEEARRLFLLLAYPPGPKLEEVDLRRVDLIVNRLGRLPLAIRLAARQRRQGVSLERLLDILEFAPEALIGSETGLKVYLGMVRKELQEMPAAIPILVRLACFPAHTAPVEALFAGIPKREGYTLESFLVERGFLDRQEGDRLKLHAFLALWLRDAEGIVFEEQRKIVEAWLLDWARQHREADGFEALEVEQANLLGLLDRFEQEERWESLVELIRDLFNYLKARGLWSVNYHFIQAVLDHVEEIRDPFYSGWAYMHRGILHLLRGEQGAAEADLEHADRIFSETGNTLHRGKALYRRAILTGNAGDLPGAAVQLEKALEWMGEEASAHDRSGAHAQLARIYAAQGSLAGAEEHFHRAIALADLETKARLSIELGSLAFDAGESEKAQSHYRQALELAAQFGHSLPRAALIQELGYLYYGQRGYDRAAGAFREAGALYGELNFSLGLAHVQHALGNVALAREDLEAARQFYQSALELNLAQGWEGNAAYNRVMLAALDRRQGRLEEASQAYAGVLQTARTLGEPGLKVAALYAMASLAFERGDRQGAAWQLQEAGELSKEIGSGPAGASILAGLGRLQSQEGHPETARQTLASAHALLAAFQALDAGEIAEIEVSLHSSAPSSL